jgi:hypothetical protein
MKKIGLLIGSLFFLFAVVSCGSTKPTVTDKESITKTTVEQVHDTVFQTAIDSSTYKALLECRGGKVVIKEVTQAEPGRKLKSPKVRIDNNQLNVDCTAEAEKMFAFWKSTQVQDIQYKTITVTKFTNILTFLQQFQIKGFRILCGLILLLVSGFIIKKYFKL